MAHLDKPSGNSDERDDTSIHDFDFNLICSYFSKLDRQGPGDEETTIKALNFIDGLNRKSKIADLGCGTGTQTITLAENAPGHITGVDLFPNFVDALNDKARGAKLTKRVRGIVGDIGDLKFHENELDLIWSEGAIYNIGFQRGLKEWRKYLKEGGYITVSEVSWFTNERPKEIDDFWKDAYSEIDTIPNKVSQLQTAGYIPVACFIIPESCWLKTFYGPQKKAQEDFLKENPDNEVAKQLIANQRHEFELYKKYKDYYGYVFYIGKKL